MTHHPRFQSATGGSDDAYRNYDGAAIVTFALALTDWWGRREARSQSAPTRVLRYTRAIPFTLTLLAAFDGTALSADVSGLTCGGDYVCVADDSVPLGTAATHIERHQPDGVSTENASVPAKEGCPQVPIDVTAFSPHERHFVCSAAADALKLLGRCRIAPRWTLHVEIMREVRHPLGRIVLGLLDTRRQRVLITQEANIDSLIEQTPYAALPRRDFYRSLIVHEVVHGVMDQNLKRAASSHAAYEYPAYALQIESLAPDVRDMFLRAFDQPAIKSDALFNDIILFFDPYVFAARAYHHFNASPDGCVRLNAVLQDAAGFILPAQM